MNDLIKTIEKEIRSLEEAGTPAGLLTSLKYDLLKITHGVLRKKLNYIKHI